MASRREFKVSVATNLKHCNGGRSSHMKALPGHPYNGHTQATVIPNMEAPVGNTLADKVTWSPSFYQVLRSPLAMGFRGWTVVATGLARGAFGSVTDGS